MNIVYVMSLPDLSVFTPIFLRYRLRYEGRNAALWICHMNSRNKLSIWKLLKRIQS